MALKLLLDTHIFIGLLEKQTQRFGRAITTVLDDREAEFYLSVASLWEIAIKSRLGKLPLQVELHKLAEIAEAAGIAMLPIQAEHVVATLQKDPATHDPFDRLLLAQCQVEGMQLITVDRALVGHLLAMRF